MFKFLLSDSDARPSIHQIILFLILCCVPAIAAAQATFVFKGLAVMPSELSWGDSYTLSFTIESNIPTTQATTLTLHVVQGGVNRRIDTLPYNLADEFLPLQRQIVLPPLEEAMTEHEISISGQVGSGLSGKTTLSYCDDSQIVCTPRFEIDYLVVDAPDYDASGNHDLSISNSALMSGSCAAVREREQAITITQIDNTASYQFTDDFGHQPTLSAVVDKDTYIFTAFYSTAPTFEGTRTLIIRSNFSDNDNGNGLAYWSYEHKSGELCRGTYEVQYKRRSPEPPPKPPLISTSTVLQMQVFLEALLLDPSYTASSLSLPDHSQVTIALDSGAFHTLNEDHTIDTISLSGVLRRLATGTSNNNEVDIYNLIFSEIIGNTLYVVDNFLHAVIAVSLSDNSRRVVSGCNIINRCPAGHYQVGDGVPLVELSDAILDRTNNRIILVDSFTAAVVAVDLSNGNRSVISGCTADFCPITELEHGAGLIWQHPIALDLDSAEARIIVADDELKALFWVDLATGERIVASGCTVRQCQLSGVPTGGIGDGAAFIQPTAVVFDEGAGFAYAADVGHTAILRVELKENKNPRRDAVLESITIRKPYHLALNESTDQLLAYNEADGSLVIYSLTDGTVIRETPLRATVCNRTPQLVDFFTRVFGKSDCADISPAELNSTITLIIDSANISTLSEGDLDGFHSVKELAITNNSLSSLPPGIFGDLSRLYHLNLNDNALTTLPEGVFSGLNELLGLDLTRNMISALPETLFSDSSALQNLSLGFNSLSSLPTNIFNGLDNLFDLILENNSLSALPADIFDGLTSLEALYLSNNSLSTLPANIFDDLTNLLVLDLHSNSLISLPANIFDGLDNLEDLNLSGNNLGTSYCDTLETELSIGKFPCD